MEQQWWQSRPRIFAVACRWTSGNSPGLGPGHVRASTRITIQSYEVKFRFRFVCSKIDFCVLCPSSSDLDLLFAKIDSWLCKNGFLECGTLETDRFQFFWTESLKVGCLAQGGSGLPDVSWIGLVCFHFFFYFLRASRVGPKCQKIAKRVAKDPQNAPKWGPKRIQNPCFFIFYVSGKLVFYWDKSIG